MRGIRFRERGVRERRARRMSLISATDFAESAYYTTMYSPLVSSDFVTFYAPHLDILLVDNLERGRSNDRRIPRSSCIVSLLLLSDKNEPGRFPRVARGQHLSSIVSAMEFWRFRGKPARGPFVFARSSEIFFFASRTANGGIMRHSMTCIIPRL